MWTCIIDIIILVVFCALGPRKGLIMYVCLSILLHPVLSIQSKSSWVENSNFITSLVVTVQEK